MRLAYTAVAPSNVDGVACRRRQKKYESAQSTLVVAARNQRLRAIAHREVGDKRRGEVDGEAGVGPLLEPWRHRREQQYHADELGPRELHLEIGGKPRWANAWATCRQDRQLYQAVKPISRQKSAVTVQ